jgi:type I restriction enzyme S subunit
MAIDNETFFENFGHLADAPNGVQKLRELILQLAVQGKLVSQDPNDEPAAKLLERIRAEKARLVKEKKIRVDDSLASIRVDEVPYELPLGWIWVRLGQIGYTNIGLTYTPSDISTTGIPVLRSNNIQDGKLNLSDLKRVNMEIKESVLVKEGDLLICVINGSRALVGKTAIITNLSENMAFGAFMAIFRSQVNDYLLYFINSPLFRKMISEVNTVTINQITQGNLKSTIFPLPPLPEQHRIVAKVDQLMALCDDLEAKQQRTRTKLTRLNNAALDRLTSSREADDFAPAWELVRDNFDLFYTTPSTIAKLRQSILQLAVQGKLVPQDPTDEPASVLLTKIKDEKERLVKEKKIRKSDPLPPVSAAETRHGLPLGWLWVRAQDIMLSITDGDHLPPPKSSKGVPLLVIGNVRSGKLDFTDTRFVPEKYYEAVDESRKPRKGDLLYTLVGSYGIPVIIDSDTDFCVQRHIGILKPSAFAASRYLLNLYGSSLVFDQATHYATGIAQKTVPLSGLRKIVLPLPPLAEQLRIVAKVDQLMALCDTLEIRLTMAQAKAEKLTTAAVQTLLAA